jgi:hypothetical protein
MIENANQLPVLVVPMKIDTDVVAAVTLWLLLNNDSPKKAREILTEADLRIVSLQYHHNCEKAEAQWPNRPVLVFDVGEEYVPGKVYDHHYWGGAPSAASLVWDEYKGKELDVVTRQSLERLIVFVNDADNYQSYFDPGQIILERLVVLLKLNNVSILNNSAFGPAHLPNVLAKLTKSLPPQINEEQARSVLLLGFDKILDWMDDERQIADLLSRNQVRSVSPLVDVVSVTSNLLPDRLRFLYNRVYRLQQKKFYVLAAVIEYPSHRQLVVHKMLSGALATTKLKGLATWLVHKFGFQYSDIKVLKNNNLLTVKIPDGMTFHLPQVADWLKYNITIKEDDKLTFLTKFFTSVFAFWEFHDSNETLVKETFELFGRLLRVVQSVDDLKPLLAALEAMEEKAQSRSDSYPSLSAVSGIDPVTSQAENSQRSDSADFPLETDESKEESAELKSVFATKKLPRD